MEFIRLLLVFGIPFAIVAGVNFITMALFPNDGSGGGGSLSAIGQIIAITGMILAVGIGFYFHFKTRRW